MFNACRSAVRSCRSILSLATGMVLASCSSAGGSGPAAPADTSNAAAPVLRTANDRQLFGSGSADSSSESAAPSSGSMVGASPVSSTPAESREALNDPILISPDAGATPPPSAAPPPSDSPSAPSDDDDDDDDDEPEDDD